MSGMQAKEITSLQHPIVKHLVQLRTERSHRLESGTALILGKKLIEELARHSPLKTLVIEKDYTPKVEIKAHETFVVTAEMMKKISGLQSPEPLAAEILLPPPADLKGKQFLLALDGINDPGNLGTLLRTALALGWEGAFITNGSVDPFNEKALRAAKGATFHLPLCFGDLNELNRLIQENNMHVYLADMHGESIEKIAVKTPVLLLLGSESHGIQPSLKKHFQSLSIPISSKMESLNVAIAGAILMYQLKKTHVR